jgi:putative DNA primase/helicase
MQDEMTSEAKIVQFPAPASEGADAEEGAGAKEGADAKQLHALAVEAERLANQSELERTFFIPKRAEAIGVPATTLRSAVAVVLRERAQRTAAERLERDEKRKQREGQRVDGERQEERARQKKEKEAEREQKRLEKEEEREQKRQEKETERKEKDKQKTFAGLSRLPIARHAHGLQKLADRLDEDVATLLEEFRAFLGVGLDDVSSMETTEPWPEPVLAATVLQELKDKVAKYVAAMFPYQQTAVALWTAHTWLYDHDIVTHSPLLAATSAEPDSGKSTLVAVLGRAAPRYSLNIEMTGPSLYRFVDARKPMLAIDEADDLFTRKIDLKHIINAGWTRGTKIPRQVSVDGVSVTVFFDPFTPKAIALLGRNLPAATRTRSIEIRMLPKLPSEPVESFHQVDDAEFAILRRKFARWAADNAAALGAAKPTMPAGLNNRAAANWTLLLAIAEQAGGTWPEQARAAAERLSSTGRRPSDGVQLLAAFKLMFGSTGNEITSEAVVAELKEDPTSVWVDYSRGSPITQRQVAHLLDAFDIHPVPLHPTKRKDFARQGYKLEQFADAFARYLPVGPIIQSSTKQKAKRKR